MLTVDKTLQEKYKLVSESIRALPLQIEQSWEEIHKLYIPEDYKNIRNVVLSGMGGSALGGRSVDSFSINRLRVPLEIFNDYHLPNYVNDSTLVIVCSYSGTTEETIDALHIAQTKGAKIFGITTGGKLADILRDKKIPSYIFSPKNNPSEQPRMATGYSLGSVLALLTKLEVINLSSQEIEESLLAMNSSLTEFGENIPESANLAKKLTADINNKIPVLVASEHLSGIAHTIKNQFNESAKTFSVLFELPELNHHLLEGLKNPSAAKSLYHFVFFDSQLYSDEVKKRYPLTMEVVEKNGISYSIFKPRTETKLSQLFEVLVFGSISVYLLTKEYRIDPLDIPWVNYFKEKLES